MGDKRRGFLKPIFKLQASTGHDDTRTCDLWPIRGNRALGIGAASLSPHLGREGSHYDGKEQRTCELQHAHDNNQKFGKATFITVETISQLCTFCSPHRRKESANFCYQDLTPTILIRLSTTPQLSLTYRF